MHRIKILIADDHSVVREGLCALLGSAPEFAIVGQASNGEEAVELADKLDPDIVILDISMPKLNGIAATHQIKANHPDIKVLILTIHENEEYVNQMIRAGANGYVVKNAENKEIRAAVKAVITDERFFSSSVSKIIIDQFIKQARDEEQNLTGREREVLSYIARGYTNKRIAAKLFLSIRTVNTHRNNIMQKLNIHDTAGLVRYAIRNGLIDTDL